VKLQATNGTLDLNAIAAKAALLPQHQRVEVLGFRRLQHLTVGGAVVPRTADTVIAERFDNGESQLPSLLGAGARLLVTRGILLTSRGAHI
jgi:hypothetical protein